MAVKKKGNVRWPSYPRFSRKSSSALSANPPMPLAIFAAMPLPWTSSFLRRSLIHVSVPWCFYGKRFVSFKVKDWVVEMIDWFRTFVCIVNLGIKNYCLVPGIWDSPPTSHSWNLWCNVQPGRNWVSHWCLCLSADVWLVYASFVVLAVYTGSLMVLIASFLIRASLKCNPSKWMNQKKCLSMICGKLRRLKTQPATCIHKDTFCQLFHNPQRSLKLPY